MKNADMPAMPQSATDSGYGCNYGNEQGQVAQGLTKREMFAMNAPECPEWFKSNFVKSNYSNKDLVARFTAIAPESAKLSFDGEMALVKAWRYAYADMMLSDD